jgi:hypothetical protein
LYHSLRVGMIRYTPRSDNPSQPNLIAFASYSTSHRPSETKELLCKRMSQLILASLWRRGDRF